MSKTNNITFVVPVNDENCYRNNLLSSPLLKRNKNIDVIEQRNFPSASLAYNDAIEKSPNDIIVFTHQDMVFPVSWENNLKKALEYLNINDPNWGVLGCYGVAQDGNKTKGHGYLYCNGNKTLFGAIFPHPVQVQTLDEVVLIIKKSSGLRFDNLLPHYHLYGVDICMTAKNKKMKCYAISAFCLHNTQKINYLTKDFFKCYKYIKNKWIDKLPIFHSCIIFKRYDFKNYINYRYYRKYKYIISKYVLYKRRGERLRSENPLLLLAELEETLKIGY